MQSFTVWRRIKQQTPFNSPGLLQDVEGAAASEQGIGAGETALLSALLRWLSPCRGARTKSRE
jgi:hypothetical protein